MQHLALFKTFSFKLFFYSISQMYIHNRLDAADWAMSGVFLSCFLTPQCKIAHQKILKTLAISITHFEMIFYKINDI